jgi:hypothetical protein
LTAEVNTCSLSLTMPASQGANSADLEQLAEAVRPLMLAGDRLLPVAAALTPLLGRPGLRRGTTIAVGSMRLGLGLAAEASAAGSWVAAVGLPSLGVVAAAEAGIVLERFPLVPSAPAASWAAVVAALLDAMDVVLAAPPPRLSAGLAGRLAAIARERGAVLVTVGAGWPHPVDLRLAVVERRWLGLGWGHGHLVGCQAHVAAAGRLAASGSARVWLWLPDHAGRLAAGSGPASGRPGNDHPGPAVGAR